MSSDEYRVLYEGNSARAGHRIRVSTDACTVNAGVYPIAELDRVGTSRGRRSWPPPRIVAGLVVVVGTLVTVLAVIAAGWTRHVGMAAAVAAVTTVVVTALPGLAGTALRRPYQIWAHHHGQPVLLFATHDRAQHGQVARALLRAMELTRD